jgi:hypothetical protein
MTIWPVVALLVAANAPPGPTAAELAGNTLSAVVFVDRPQGVPSELGRYMFQAYLGIGGGAVVRVWNPARNAYGAAVATGWSLSGNTLCVDLHAGPGRVCADVHVWGPRIAGIGTRPYVMLDGDLQPGNAIGGGRR